MEKELRAVYENEYDENEKALMVSYAEAVMGMEDGASEDYHYYKNRKSKIYKALEELNKANESYKEEE